MILAKTVSAKAHVQRHRRSAGLSIAQLHTEHLPDHLDPYLAFDHFQMAEPFFPPHPHAGFSAVTYMFPQSDNGFVNRDSRGERIEIHPGDLHWTCAGSGLMHEEVPIVDGRVCHGLQIFVNLPAVKKWMKPEVFHLGASDVPRVTAEGVDVGVVIGTHQGRTSPLVPPTDVTLLDVVLADGGRFAHQTPAGQSRFVYVIEGSVEAGPVTAAVPLHAGDAAGFSENGDGVFVRATGGPAHVVVAGGRPLREPTVFYGPFCMSTREDVLRAVHDYETGKMGHLESEIRRRAP